MTDVLELFAGAGGSSEGLRMLGLDHTGIELDPVAASTAVAAGHRRVVADVAATNPGDFAGVDGIWSSPPCTSFSSSGTGAGRRVMHVLADGITRTARGERVMSRVRRDCARILKAHALADRMSPQTRARRSEWAWWQAAVSALVVEVARYVHVLRPEWVVCEQVPGVLPLWRVLCAALRQLGYRAWCGVLVAADYGVPQTRKRAIFMASRNAAHHVGPPEPTHAEDHGEGNLFGLPRWVCMADALGLDWPDRAAPTVSAGGTATGGAEVFANAGFRRQLLAYRRTRGAGMNERHGSRPDTDSSQPAPAITGKARSDRWVFAAAGRTGLSPDRDLESEPAATITAKANGDREGGERQFPEQTVRVSVAEAACLQSFAAGYPWQGTRTRQYQQCGNAVPPPVTAAVVGHLLGIDLQPLVASYLTRTTLTAPLDGAA